MALIITFLRLSFLTYTTGIGLHLPKGQSLDQMIPCRLFLEFRQTIFLNQRFPDGFRNCSSLGYLLKHRLLDPNLIE